MPARLPRREKATARLAVSDDLPTPPLPLATAITRVLFETRIPFVRSSTPPRSFVVSACFSSGLITSKASETDATPGTAPTSSCTWSWNDERSGQPATVRAIITATWPRSISTDRTISSSVTGRRSSGSITPPSAWKMASRLGSIAFRA